MRAIALDAALLHEVIDHDLGAERVQVRAAAGQRTGVVEHHPDLQLLRLRRSLPGQKCAEDERCRDQSAREAPQPTQEHDLLLPAPEVGNLGARAITDWAYDIVKRRAVERRVDIGTPLVKDRAPWLRRL
jgi:hypothetical protein